MWKAHLKATVVALSLAILIVPDDLQGVSPAPSKEAQEDTKAKDIATITTLVTGPVVDTHLTALYSYLVRNHPNLLSPLPIDPSLYKTVSEAVLKTGVLTRYYPKEFTSQVYVPLSKWARYSAMPGLKPVPYEYPAIVRKIEAQKIGRDLCQIYRFDGKDCAVKPSDDYLYLRGQGVRITLEVPRQQVAGIIQGLRDSLKANRGYDADVKIFAEKQMQAQNLPTTEDWPAQFKSFKNADGNEEDGTMLRQRIKAYYEAIDYCAPSRSAVAVQILILDVFPHEEGTASVRLTHPNFSEKATPYVPCLTNNPSKEGHGTHVAGLIAAKPNGCGIVGVSPTADLVLWPPEGKDISSNDLIQALEFAHQTKDYEVKIFHASLAGHFGYDSGIYKTLNQHFKGSQLDRLFVFSAGNKRTSEDNSTRLSEQNCGVLPACLGHLPNVVVVAALDREPRERPRLLETSYCGAPMVSLAAPGVGILSTDLNDQYSLREGTSVAAPFVTGAAALVWQASPHLDAYKVKQRLVATARFDLDFGRSEDIVGGVLDIAAAVKDISEDVVVLENSAERLVGKIEAKLFRGDLLLYDRERYLPNEKAPYAIKAEDLLRIHRRGNRFTVACKCEFPDLGKRVGVTVLHNKILNPVGAGMQCLKDKNCLTIRYREPSGQEVSRDIDLFNVSDIYFGFGN